VGIAQKVAPAACGTLRVQVGAGFATGPSDAEQCFHQAFLACTPAFFTVETNPISRGYGEQLMAAAECLAQEAGAYRLSLMSNAQRPAAHRFYERLGYRPSHQGFIKYFI
jgi:GNAT superfamily N-acetyltransferase